MVCCAHVPITNRTSEQRGALLQERAELEAWREQVRAKYEEVGYGAQIPDDLPRQLRVGQRVTARHPVTRQIHDGDVLTTAPKYYR